MKQKLTILNKNTQATDKIKVNIGGEFSSLEGKEGSYNFAQTQTGVYATVLF